MEPSLGIYWPVRVYERKTLAKNVDERYGCAREFSRALYSKDIRLMRRVSLMHAYSRRTFPEGSRPFSGHENAGDDLASRAEPALVAGAGDR